MMQVQQTVIEEPGAWSALERLTMADPQLLLVFGAVRFFESAGLRDALQARFPAAQLVGCSTAGEIAADGVRDGTCTVTAIRFEATPLRCAVATVQRMEDSELAGQQLGQELLAPDLKAVLVFGPGVLLNGSALVNGLSAVLGTGVPVVGGLAGDGGAFKQTFTLGPQGVDTRGVVAVGLYGDRISLGHGSFGGWLPFGPARQVTRSEGNVLYELDGEPALEIYKRYLGDHAKGLPASGLLFPFAMQSKADASESLIRTILGINEAEGSLTLAGEIDPQGYLKLMQASTDRLVHGAEGAAEAALQMLTDQQPVLALLVSCVGRKLVMGERVDEEVEAVAEVFGRETMLTGFYSNGEICPMRAGYVCGLHNQTMTVTTLREN